VIGFAVAGLGWGTAGVGFLASSPFIGYVLQPPISYVLQRRLSLHAIIRWAFVFNALPWFLVNLFPYLDPATRDLLFGAAAYISAQANAVCGVAWSASMSELVPLGIRGRYFGQRNLYYGFWSLLAVLVAGHVADRAQASLTVFGIIYSLAALSRLGGLYFFSRMVFPPSVMTVAPHSMRLDGFRAPLRDRDFLWLLAFNGLCGLLLFTGIPFYNVFVLTELHFSLGQLAILTTLANLAGLVSVSTWTPLSDRFGVRPVLMGSILAWTTSSAILWLLMAPGRAFLAYPAYAVYGFMWALFQLLQLTFIMKMAPAAQRTHYFSTFYAVTYLFTFIGPFLGGTLLGRLPRSWGTLFGQPLTRYHVVFAGSLALCLATVAILKRVREPAAGSLRDVVRAMRSSAQFNPLLMLVSVAEQLFGGRAIAVMLSQSKRALRRQRRALTDVGEELAQGSYRAIRRRIKGRRRAR